MRGESGLLRKYLLETNTMCALVSKFLFSQVCIGNRVCSPIFFFLMLLFIVFVTPAQTAPLWHVISMVFIAVFVSPRFKKDFRLTGIRCRILSSWQQIHVLPNTVSYFLYGDPMHRCSHTPPGISKGRKPISFILMRTDLRASMTRWSLPDYLLLWIVAAECYSCHLAHPADTPSAFWTY